MIDLERVSLDEIVSIIRRHLPKCRLIMFGSRVNGMAEKFSDVDIAIDNCNPIKWNILYDIKEHLSLTNIPYIVDIADYNDISESFRHIISSTGVIFS